MRGIAPHVAVVLGAAVRPDGTASPTLALRTRHAADLWRTGRVTHICTTGGPGHDGPPEAHVARDLLRGLAIPDSALLSETTSTNTVGNIANALATLPEGARITLVSNRWHLPRAWLIARLMGYRTALSGPRGAAPTASTAFAILREVAATPLSVIRAIAVRR